jgi:hypothetical protein
VLILERAIGRDRQDRDAAAAVVGNDQELAGGIDSLTNAVLAASGGAVEQLGLTGGAIEREGSGIVFIAMNRVEKALIGAQREI